MEFQFTKLKVYKLQPVVFIKFWKIPDIKFTVEFLFIEADAIDFLVSSSCSKQRFGKL